jgi:hypothetical protein
MIRAEVEGTEICGDSAVEDAGLLQDVPQVDVRIQEVGIKGHSLYRKFSIFVMLPMHNMGQSKIFP